MRKSAVLVGASASILACLLIYGGYRLFIDPNSPDLLLDSQEQQIRLPSTRRENPNPEATGDQYALSEMHLGVGQEASFDPLDLANAAQSDPAAAERLVAYFSICTEYLLQFAAVDEGGRGKPDARFEHPAWAELTARCDLQTYDSLLASLRGAAQHQSGEWEAIDRFSKFPLADESARTAEDLEERDKFAQAILETSRDPELIAAAAMLYFDSNRLRNLAGSNLPDSLLRDDVSGFSGDLATLIACRMGRDCSPLALRTISQCVKIPSCRPGMSMEQIVLMRRSPQEMELIDEFVRQVLRNRRG